MPQCHDEVRIHRVGQLNMMSIILMNNNKCLAVTIKM